MPSCILGFMPSFLPAGLPSVLPASKPSKQARKHASAQGSQEKRASHQAAGKQAARKQASNQSSNRNMFMRPFIYFFSQSFTFHLPSHPFPFCLLHPAEPCSALWPFCALAPMYGEIFSLLFSSLHSILQSRLHVFIHFDLFRVKYICWLPACFFFHLVCDVSCGKTGRVLRGAYFLQRTTEWRVYFSWNSFGKGFIFWGCF